MDRKFAVIGFALFIMGCTTTQEIKRPDGQTEYLIACGASLGWNVCYKASEYEQSRKLGQGAHSKISAVNGTVLFWCAKNGTLAHLTPDQTVRFWPQMAQFSMCAVFQFSTGLR